MNSDLSSKQSSLTADLCDSKQRIWRGGGGRGSGEVLKVEAGVAVRGGGGGGGDLVAVVVEEVDEAALGPEGDHLVLHAHAGRGRPGEQLRANLPRGAGT